MPPRTWASRIWWSKRIRMPRSHICESCAGPAPRPARAGPLLSPPFVVPRLRRQRRRHGTAERGSHAPHRPLVTEMAVVVVGLPPEEGPHVAAAGEREAREEEKQGDPGWGRVGLHGVLRTSS